MNPKPQGPTLSAGPELGAVARSVPLVHCDSKIKIESPTRFLSLQSPGVFIPVNLSHARQ